MLSDLALYYEAMMAGQNPKATLEFYQKQNLLPAVKMAMLEDRILTMLLDEKINTSSESKSEKPKATKAVKELKEGEEKSKKAPAKKTTAKKEEK